VQVGGATAKRVQTIKVSENGNFYMYVLNASGNPYIYSIENSYG